MTIRDQWIKGECRMCSNPTQTTPTYIENCWIDEAGLIDGLTSTQLEYLNQHAVVFRLRAFDDVKPPEIKLNKHTPPFWANNYRNNKRKKK